MASSLIVPVTTIDSILPHPGADRLEIARVLGWQMNRRIARFEATQSALRARYGIVATTPMIPRGTVIMMRNG